VDLSHFTSRSLGEGWLRANRFLRALRVLCVFVLNRTIGIAGRGRNVKPPNDRGREARAAESNRPGAVKDMILEALARAGGVEYLTNQAKENPRAFLSLLTKVIPPEVADRNGGVIEQVLRWANSDDEATPDPSRQ
jgi:hypothetical protein